MNDCRSNAHDDLRELDRADGRRAPREAVACIMAKATARQPAAGLDGARLRLVLAGWLLVSSFAGCAAVTFPVAGIPAHQVPDELLAKPKDGARTIDLSLLGQPAVDLYRLGPRDVLGVWIDGILGERGQVPPIHYSMQEELPPGLGFPIPVREDGTISLPLVAPIPVAGLSLAEAEAAVVRAYTVDRPLLQPGLDRILVTLIRPRTYRVLVVRQESIGGATLVENNFIRNQKRGTGHRLELPAYENDVLTALTRTGGLPGLEAANKIRIERGRRHMPADAPAGAGIPASTEGYEPIIEIPLRMYPDEPLAFGPEDVILRDGDVVFIESRDEEVFYTGGILPTGEYTLPRDYDLDVVEAISMVSGTLANGGLQTNSVFTSSFVEGGGVGGPSPSLVVILRRTPDGRQVPIRVDLNQALRDSRERILIQPGDVILLQETPDEAIARYVARVFRFFIDWQVWDQGDSSGLSTVVVP